jgi:hypothetical protein
LHVGAGPLRYALLAVEPDDDDEEDEPDEVVELGEPPLDELFVSEDEEDEEDDESEPLLADSFTFSFAPPFELPERLSVL